MFISPENFLQIYKSSGLPLFYIRKGETASGKIMKRFVKKFDRTDPGERQERISEGVELLDAFFSSYDYGEINIELMASPQDQKDSRLYHCVAWGEKPKKYGNSKTSQDQSNQNWMLFNMMMNMQQNQNSLMLDMMKESNQRERKHDKQTYELQLDKFKLENELEAAGAPDFNEALKMELVGAIKPITAAVVAGKNPMMAAQIMSTVQQPTVSGMQKTEEATDDMDAADKDTAKPKPATSKAPKHCLYNMSMDTIMKCVQHFMVEVFPDYNVNEVMPVMAMMVVEQKAMIRPLVLDAIHRQRGQSNEKEVAQTATNEEEDE